MQVASRGEVDALRLVFVHASCACGDLRSGRMMRLWQSKVADVLMNVRRQHLAFEEDAMWRGGAVGGVGNVRMATPQKSRWLTRRALAFCLFRLVQRSSRGCICLSWRPV